MTISFDAIKSDMDKKCTMLTDAQVLVLAKKINLIVDLPFYKDEEKELIIFCKVIRKIDQELYRLLPNEYYELVHNASDGISEAEAEQLRKRIVPLLNKAIDIPVLTEDMEEFLIDLVLRLIISALVKGCKLNEQ